MKTALERLRTLPFERLIAGLVIISGVVGLIRTLSGEAARDPLDQLLPTELVIFFEVAYLVAGVGMIWGVGAAKARVEALGLVVLASATVVRLLAIVVIVGITFDVLVALVLYSLVLHACYDRLQILLHRQTLFLSRGDRDRGA